MKKKILALVLAALMLVSVLAGCKGEEEGANYVGADECGEYELISIPGFDHQFKKYKNMTDQNITLTYFNFDSEPMTKALAEVFMKIYPNIHVDVSWAAAGDYNTTLNTLISDRKTPDVVMFTDVDYALSNRIPMDISRYWNSDDETKNLAKTIESAGIGTFQLKGGQRYGVPVKFFPIAIAVDRNVLKTLNIDIPDQNWQWSEMIDIIKKGTQPASRDGQAYYGLFAYTRLDSLYGIAAGQDIIGEFGFDGYDFDLSIWAVGEQEYGDLRKAGYVAPDRDTLENEEWLGDPAAWSGLTGHVAIFTEPFWTYQNIWLADNGEGMTQMEANNLDIVPYVVPAVKAEDAAGIHNTIATIDMGGVSNSTKYPREAYELLKFMSFGVDGWYARCAIYNDPTQLTSAGQPMRTDNMPVPLTLDEGVWDEYIKMFCVGMDEEHTEHWRQFFASAMQPIPYGWESIAGYISACDGYFNDIGIHGIVDSGTGQAADYAAEATQKFNWYHADAMLRYFGPDGYNVLTQEEIDSYTKLLNENAG